MLSARQLEELPDPRRQPRFRPPLSQVPGTLPEGQGQPVFVPLLLLFFFWGNPVMYFQIRCLSFKYQKEIIELLLKVVFVPFRSPCLSVFVCQLCIFLSLCIGVCLLLHSCGFFFVLTEAKRKAPFETRTRLLFTVYVPIFFIFTLLTEHLQSSTT